MEQTVTAKIQIKTDKQTTELLEQAMYVYMQACSLVAEYVDNTHQLKQRYTFHRYFDR